MFAYSLIKSNVICLLNLYTLTSSVNKAYIRQLKTGGKEVGSTPGEKDFQTQKIKKQKSSIKWKGYSLTF